MLNVVLINILYKQQMLCIHFSSNRGAMPCTDTSTGTDTALKFTLKFDGDGCRRNFCHSFSRAACKFHKPIHVQRTHVHRRLCSLLSEGEIVCVCGKTIQIFSISLEICFIYSANNVIYNDVCVHTKAHVSRVESIPTLSHIK